MGWKQILIFIAMVLGVLALNSLSRRFTGWDVDRVFSKSLPATTAAPGGGAVA